MKFTLNDIESGKDIASKVRGKKNKKQPKYTHLPEEDVPYSSKTFSKFVDYSYDVLDEHDEE